MIRHPQVKLCHLKLQGVLYVDIILLCETDSSIPRAKRVKKAKLEELSNNISERRCELKANGSVSERSERASGYTQDLQLGERSEVSGKSGVYCIIHI